MTFSQNRCSLLWIKDYLKFNQNIRKLMLKRFVEKITLLLSWKNHKDSLFLEMTLPSNQRCGNHLSAIVLSILIDQILNKRTKSKLNYNRDTTQYYLKDGDHHFNHEMILFNGLVSNKMLFWKIRTHQRTNYGIVKILEL